MEIKSMGKTWHIRIRKSPQFKSYAQEDTDVSKVGVLVKEFTFLNGKWDFA